MKEQAVMMAPVTAYGRAPFLSLSHPETGPAARNPMVMGSRKIAGQKGALS